ncbi:MAG: glycoside hydrolase family 16 protein [Spirochaetes bacterium]|nr:glycoside hydrolase family 16 protein [Spirochaetota bacterium]
MRILCIILAIGNMWAQSGSLLPDGAMESIWVVKGAVTPVDVPGQAFAKAFHASVAQKPVNAWDVQIEARIPAAFTPGTIEISFKLRDASSNRETSVCSAGIVIITRPGNKLLGFKTVNAGQEWKTIRYHYSVSADYASNTVGVAITFGGMVQELEIGDIRVRTVSEKEKAEMLAEERMLRAAEAAQRPRIDGLPSVPAGETWKIAFQDEFDGTTVDETKWTIREGKRRDMMRSRKAVSLDGDGHLVMSIFKEGDKFYDSWIDTKNKWTQTYGFWTARIKLHRSEGHWIAFWLMPQSGNTVGSPGREIDIMECNRLNDEVNHAIHWNGYGKDHKSEGHREMTPGLTEGWHTYSLLWTPEDFVFYVDDAEVYRTSAAGGCHVPEYIKVTDEAEAKPSSWAGDVNTAKLPDSWMVDYVRVYQRVDAKTGKPVWTPPPQAPKE